MLTYLLPVRNFPSHPCTPMLQILFSRDTIFSDDVAMSTSKSRTTQPGALDGIFHLTDSNSPLRLDSCSKLCLDSVDESRYCGIASHDKHIRQHSCLHQLGKHCKGLQNTVCEARLFRADV